MRIAFADLLFSWPPNGGADIDAFEVIRALHAVGHETMLFHANVESAEDRGIVRQELPFPAQPVCIAARDFNGPSVGRLFHEALSSFRPQAVFAMHAYSLKPWLLEALAEWPLVSRYYAHELTCARDPRRFRDAAPCPHDYLREPEVCRPCALAHQRAAICREEHRAWTADYLAAEAWRPEHHARTLSSLRKARTLIVSNQTLKQELAPFHDDVRVVPGGAKVSGISPTSAPAHDAGQPLIILMPGRADDPLKGLEVLSEAGRLLWQSRQDFQIHTTHYDHALRRPWLETVGWHDHAGAMALYAKADIVAVPSVWQEPFGLVAVEGMAAARPVVASRVGGLADIVRHESTGLLVTPNDAGEFAAALARLLEEPALRERLGNEGRRVAETEYDWDRVIERHYLPLLGELSS